MIRGAIFDVDGTILDSMAIWEEAAEKYLYSLGKEPEKNLSRKIMAMSVEEGSAYVKEKYRLLQSEEEIGQGVLAIVRDFYFYDAPVKKGVREFLEGLSRKGIPMAIATSSTREHIEAAFQRLGILNLFKEIFTCSEVGEGKSKPLIYEKAAECLGKKPEEIYVFEDAVHAAKTANAAGFVTVGVYDRFSEEDQAELKNIVDIYLMDMSHFEEFWKSEGWKNENSTDDSRK